MKFNGTNLAIAALLTFGLLTVFMAGSVIFDLFGIREKEGNYISFIVWANFICGILYLVAGYGWLKKRSWAAWLMLLAVVILIISFGALLIFINSGKAYENKTLAAMVFRTAVTLALLVFITRGLNRDDALT